MKTDAEKIEIMRAFHIDKVPLELLNLNKENAQWEDCYNPSWSWDKYDYRLKKDKEVPYENFEEFIEAWKQHHFVQHKESKEYLSILSADPKRHTIIIGADNLCSLSDLFHNFIWDDGTICGKKEKT